MVIEIVQRLDSYTNNQLTIFTLKTDGSIYYYTVINYNRSFSEVYAEAKRYFNKVRNSSKVLADSTDTYL